MFIFYKNIKNTKFNNILMYILIIAVLTNSSLFIYNRMKDMDTFKNIQEDLNYLSNTAIISTSQRSFLGRSLTATHERAGLLTKYFP